MSGLTRVFNTNIEYSPLKSEQVGEFPEKKVWLKMVVVLHYSLRGLVTKQKDDEREPYLF